MTEAMKKIDSIISNMSSKRHIIYFKSENRKIIQKVINQSVALQEKLLQLNFADKKISGNWFQKLCEKKLCVDITTVFEFNKICGAINLDGNKPIPVVVFLSDFQVFNDQARGYLLKAFLDCEALKNSYFLISSPLLRIPDGFGAEIEFVSDGYISKKDILEKITMQVREEEKKRGYTFFSDSDLKKKSEDFVGLTEDQVDSVLMRMRGVLCTGLRDHKHLDEISAEKRKEVEKDPTVSFLAYPEKPIVTGLGHYSTWLQERIRDFKDPVNAQKQGTPAPKGVLLCGVPGTGKTAMAKETARCLEVPLIQFDISRIQTKDFGGSEEKLRRYLERISAFGSCVMLMDEVEKIFAVNENTHEVKRAMLSLVLDWMQTREANVFTFITANDISSLPPELLRDGRISGRFFAFMPSRDDLCQILCLKLGTLAQNHMLNQEFKHLLDSFFEKDNANKNNPIYDMFDYIAEESEKINKYPFMTGANVESLVEMTNREMRKNSQPPYGISNYTKKMAECALSSDFVPQGQSNMEDLVKMWLAAQKRQYQDVSDHTILPFSSLKEGEFINIPDSDNVYDCFMRKVLREKIEKACEEKAGKIAALKQYTKNSR